MGHEVVREAKKKAPLPEASTSLCATSSWDPAFLSERPHQSLAWSDGARDPYRNNSSSLLPSPGSHPIVAGSSLPEGLSRIHPGSWWPGLKSMSAVLPAQWTFCMAKLASLCQALLLSNRLTKLGITISLHAKLKRV